MCTASLNRLVSVPISRNEVGCARIGDVVLAEAPPLETLADRRDRQTVAYPSGFFDCQFQ
ncbi:hypothetical protein GCM10017690_27710 [Microbacterium terregens]